MVSSPKILRNAGATHGGYSVASKLSGAIQRWRDYLNFLCLALLFTYLAFIPGGMLGLGIAVACLVTKLTMTRNIESLGIYMLLFGIKTLGLVTLYFGYPGIGGKVGLVIGITIVVFFTDFRKTFIDLNIPFVYLIWIALVLYLSYLNGPQTSYCTDKLINTIIYGTVLLIAFYYLINKRSVDWFHIGQLGVLSALVCLSIYIILSPQGKPSSVLDLSVMRITYLNVRDVFGVRNVVGGIALLGFVLIYASSPDRRISRLSLVHLYIYLYAGLVILLWVGSRLFLVSLIIVIMSMFLVKPLHRNRYRLLTGIVMGISILVLTYSVSQQFRFVTSIADTSGSFAHRINRDKNWEAGYNLFIENPIFGLGLGGYYIEGYSNPGEGTYAHNLALELLSETGVIGTLLILTPLLLWRNSRRSISFLTRAQSGSAVFPLLLLLFLQAMVSFDLSGNIGLFSLIGAIAMATQSSRRKSHIVIFKRILVDKN